MNHLPDYTELTAARLENAELRDKVQALSAALRKEVLAIIREEVAKALAPKMIEATYVVSPEDAARIKARLEGGAS